MQYSKKRNGMIDQAHFIKDFKQYTGDIPENFKRFLKKTIFYNHTGGQFLIFAV
jgi:hypothetical protein